MLEPAFPPLTCGCGSPVVDDNHCLTLGRNGPVLLQDVTLLEKLLHFDRERIPERVVYARGAGAYGQFELSADLSEYTRAHFLGKAGRTTDVFVRFSTMVGERGSGEAERDVRGFAVRFYTAEGNYDLVGSNMPVFSIRDPMKFPDLIHAQKRLSDTNLRSANAMWDFWSLAPESLHHVVMLMSDRGIPATYRHMHGYGNHTYMWYNDKNDYYWVKYHFKSEQGILSLSSEEARRVLGRDRDHATRDLYAAIGRGEYPAWQVDVQIATPDQVREFAGDCFDPTRIWPHDMVRPVTIGRLVLNRAPCNYFDEVEQAALTPGNFVPGIGPSPDKLLQGRLLSCQDAHMYRLGPNHQLLPVNRPRGAGANYYAGGTHRSALPARQQAAYWPNSLGGPAPRRRPEPMLEYTGVAARFPQPVREEDHAQVRALYRDVMNDAERARLLHSIAEHLGDGVLDRVRLRVCVMFSAMDRKFAAALASLVDVDPNRVEELAALEYEEVIAATGPVRDAARTRMQAVSLR